MKKILLFSIFCMSATASVFAVSYNVHVDTYVGDKLEDKFEFVIKEGEVQQKGYDGKYLAKRFLAKGFSHVSANSLKEDDSEETVKQPKEEKSIEQIISEKIFQLRNEQVSAEKRSENSQLTIQKCRDEIAELEEIEKLMKGSPMSAKLKFEQYMKKHEPSKEDIADAKRMARMRKIKYQDFEEYDIGSYCRMRIVKVINPQKVRFNISFAYSRLLSMAYHDGKNTDNAITKYPVFEIFERLNTSAKITLGKPYCIQFTRPSSIEEAKTIQDAIAQTRLFSGVNDVPSLPSANDNSDDDEKDVEAPKGKYDAKGSYEKIRRKYQFETPKTVRAVFTVTAIK